MDQATSTPPREGSPGLVLQYSCRNLHSKIADLFITGGRAGRTTHWSTGAPVEVALRRGIDGRIRLSYFRLQRLARV
jgi:hypothetical protein